MKSLSETLGMKAPETHRCPRRVESVGGQLSEGPDHWRHWGCSYCGSMPPDLFMEAVRQGSPLGPTDKNYKVYIDWSGGVKFYFQHLSQQQMREFLDLYKADQLVVRDPGYFYVLPFFMGRSLPPEKTD